MTVGVLLVQAGSRTCAVPLSHVIETMRPLHVEPLAGAPPCVMGASIIRGAVTPVLALSAVVGAPPSEATRFVTIRAGARTVALAVESVIGLREISGGRLLDAPPLLQGALSESVGALDVLDAQLLFVLRATKLVPREVWSALPS